MRWSLFSFFAKVKDSQNQRLRAKKRDFARKHRLLPPKPPKSEKQDRFLTFFDFDFL